MIKIIYKIADIFRMTKRIYKVADVYLSSNPDCPFLIIARVQEERNYLYVLEYDFHQREFYAWSLTFEKAKDYLIRKPISYKEIEEHFKKLLVEYKVLNIDKHLLKLKEDLNFNRFLTSSIKEIRSFAKAFSTELN